MEKIKNILFVIKEKALDVLWFINKKIGFKKLIALILIVVFIGQIIAAVIINNSVLGKNGLTGSEKANKLIHIKLSEDKYISWLQKNSNTVKTEGDEDHTLKARALQNYASSHSYIIISHPYAKTSYDMAEFAYHFYDMGFHIYLPDMRGFGESDYKTVFMGYKDYKDIIRWINYIIEKDKDAKIFLFGLGLGGTASLLTANKELPENVKGIIADSAYSDVNELFKYNIKELYSVPGFPIVEIGSVYNKLINGWSFKDIDVEGCVKHSSVPILYIQGGEDQVVPTEQINDLYDITTAEKSDHLLIPGGTHCENADFDSEKYWDKVDLFILSTMDL